VGKEGCGGHSRELEKKKKRVKWSPAGVDSSGCQKWMNTSSESGALVDVTIYTLWNLG
jgi:hypothetical protein